MTTSVAVKGGFMYPRPPIGIVGAASLGTIQSLTASGHKAGMIFEAPKPGNIRKIGHRVGTIVGTASVNVRLETVDTATGNPSGTLIQTDSSATQASLASNTFYTTQLTGDVLVTKGQLLAAVIEYAAGTSIATQYFADEGGNPKDYPYCAGHNGTSWTKIAGAPVLAVEYDDGSYEPIIGCWPFSAVSTATVTSATTPDCVGVYFQVPFDCTIGGAWVWADCSAANASFNIKLYGTDGTTPLATYSHGAGLHVVSAAGLYFCTFDTSATIVAATNYRLAVEGASSGNVVIQVLETGTASLMDAVEGGSAFVQTTAKDPANDASWTQTTTKRPFIGPIIDSIATTPQVGEDAGTMYHLKSGVNWPRPPLGLAGTPTLSTIGATLTSGKRAAEILEIPKAGVINKVAIKTGTVTATPTITIRLETVDEDTGFPTGTLIAVGASATSATLVSNTMPVTTLTTPPTVTKGQRIAVVCEYASGTDAIIQAFTDEGGNSRDYPYVASYNGTTWTKANGSPIVALEYDDGSYESILGCWPIVTASTVTVTNATTPDRVGIKFSVPFGCTVKGAWVWLDCTASNANWTIELIDADGSTVIGSHNHFATMRVAAFAGLYLCTFQGSASLKANIPYRLTVRGAGTGNVVVQALDTLNSSTMGGLPGGSSFAQTTAKNPIADISWTQTGTKRPFMGPIIDGINPTVAANAGGSGFFVFFDS